VSEVEKGQGKRPDPPTYPPEPVFLGDPTKAEAKQTYEQECQVWNDQVQTLNRDYQDAVMQWESRGMRLSQRWDLSPVPELASFDSRPPEQREWIPVRVFENQVTRSQKAQRVPSTTRSWRRNPGGQWRETLAQGETWKPYGTEELKQILQGEACVHLPETLMVAVPGGSFLPFLNQLEREALALVRCRWDQEGGQLVPASPIPQTLVQPAVEIVASVALSDLGALPVTRWPGVPAGLERLPGWEPGQQVPATREQFAALESWVSAQADLPRWYVSPEYRSLVATNLCCAEARATWGEDYLWRPLLDGASAHPDSDWQPTL
jgi:hypothetical protein